MAQSKREETKGSKTKGRDIANTIPPPPGFDSKPLEHTKQATKRDHKADLNELKSKKIYESAIGPAKSIPMNAFMSYMTGNSLQIIPVTMTMMLLWNPIKAIFNDLNPTFSKLKTEDNSSLIFFAKLGFIFFQLMNMSIGIYKLYTMGLIPHSEADWLAWLEAVPSLDVLHS
ncbi:Emc4 protein [Candida orthopsilosis Co 90-125]|uniref:ER membrane protein complex subunit 4 n=1 Tax=Candida orthopsilosis (strain 90-125) TaxID=1136231 RepID=H8XAT3_CANO9|nr:Emc4 protein [Candida orthopsilosis Co 90-125]CCG24934.1 Emc4 protein [Candida orthopsilosis Co 90-125]